MTLLRSTLAVLAAIAVVSSGASALALQDAPAVDGPTPADGPEATGATATTATTWWNADWQYKRPIDVTEQSGTDLRNYPVVTPTIDIGSASPASIRVVDEATGEVLDFGVRETGDGYRLAFQVNVGARQTRSDIAVYYGNPAASSATVPWNQARYNVYDGFDDGSLDSKWTVESGQWTESGGALKPRGDGVRIHRNLSQSLVQSNVPIYWETRVISRSTGGGTDQRRAWLVNENGEGHRLLFVRTYQNGDDGVGVNIGWNSPDRRKLLAAGQFAVDQPIREEVVLRPNGDIEAYAENEANGETGSKVYDAEETYRYSRIVFRDHGGDPGAEWDYVKIRYRLDSEPAVSVGDRRTRSPTRTTTVTTATTTTTAATTTTTAATTTTTAAPTTTTVTPTTTPAESEPPATTAEGCRPSNGEPRMQAVQLHTDDTTVRPDDPGQISGAIASDITNDCPVKVQITLQVPNGVRVSGGSNIQSSGGGLSTSTFVVEPGEIKNVRAEVYGSDPGPKTVQASITYFPVGHQNMAKQEDGLSLQFEVEEVPDEGETTTDAEARDSDGDGVPDDVDYAPNDPSVQSKSDLDTGLPGFSLSAGVVALALAALVAARRR
ncbi:hypothetical protein [Halorussus caseinilyticus]|uniref:hypothetical protein n=1 Tax=Halorussus caseinilyticus TaxID=3034025 RepID=UPI0023E7F755|nr:hypothetical protein [Halorussus sp. DT72]